VSRRALVINPGSTSTKIAVFEEERALFTETVRHSVEELRRFSRIPEQLPYRKEMVLKVLAQREIACTDLAAVVGRGGLCRPLESGTYVVDAEMEADLRSGVLGDHASNLGGLIALEIARPAGVPAYIVDPVVVDELSPLARLTGLKQIRRRSIFHALNQKAVARRAARELGRPYEELQLIVAHLGGGISVGLHQRGKVTDVNNALDGDGPFAPERAGSLPTGLLVSMCFSGKYTEAEIRRKLAGQGGLVDHIGTNDGREMEERVRAGDAEATLAIEGMAYQIAKWIGSLAVVVQGKVDAILLTGSLAHFPQLVQWITDRVRWIAEVRVYPGEDEMTALAEAVFRVIRGEETPRTYAQGLQASA